MEAWLLVGSLDWTEGGCVTALGPGAGLGPSHATVPRPTKIRFHIYTLHDLIGDELELNIVPFLTVLL